MVKTICSLFCGFLFLFTVFTDLCAEVLSEQEVQQIRCNRAETILLPRIIEYPNTEDDFRTNMLIYGELQQMCNYKYDEYRLREVTEAHLRDVVFSNKF